MIHTRRQEMKRLAMYYCGANSVHGKTLPKDLYDLYKKPSENKLAAFRLCLMFAQYFEAKWYGISAHNSNFFTFVFCGIADGRSIFVKMTAYNTYFIYLDEVYKD